MPICQIIINDAANIDKDDHDDDDGWWGIICYHSCHLRNVCVLSFQKFPGKDHWIKNL